MFKVSCCTLRCIQHQTPKNISLFIPRATTSITSIAHYATAANEDPELDHHKRLDIHPWPKTKDPTPYEIFNLGEQDKKLSTKELKKILKKTYLAYVKLYHPDTSLVIHHKGKPLSSEEKKKRFELVQKAYDILKDPRRRIAYERYQTTSWEQQTRMPDPADGFSKEHFEAYRRANAFRGKYSFENNEEFWRAATWEDYYRARYKRPAPTVEELEKNKYKILYGVLAVGAIAFALQISRAVDRVNERLLDQQKLNLKTMRALNESYDNYGMGEKEADRVRRFIAARRANLVGKFDATISEFSTPQEEDRHALVQYAKKKVKKWDDEDAYGLQPSVLPLSEPAEISN
ncbi:JID1 [[Candida] subhashii]|uniref:JID1 n=1 Tax=[Candida] subhashii TaxID=561895 RepID=A0A8J5QIT6_9ASCO|nr:JID1 [[Candida] subhashii]KAG7665451.1 JID1 [[Candida] subhashii]